MMINTCTGEWTNNSLEKGEDILEKSRELKKIIFVCLTIIGIIFPSGRAQARFENCIEMEISKASISIDGNFDDWSGVTSFVSDPSGDDDSSTTGDDIKAVYFAKDDNNIFIRMDLWDNLNTNFGNAPPPNDGRYSFFVKNIDFGIGYNPSSGKWEIGVNGSGGPTELMGSSYVGVSSQSLEVRIPLSSLDTSSLFRIIVESCKIHPSYNILDDSQCVLIGDGSQNPTTVITTTAAAKVTKTTATLNGIYNNHTNDLTKATAMYFEYGKTTSYENKINSSGIISLDNSVGFFADIAGLEPDTTYHFRLVITDDSITYYGSDQQFKTSSDNPDNIDTLYLYENFDDNTFPISEDWQPTDIDVQINDGKLYVKQLTEKNEGRFFFAGNADIIQYDFQINRASSPLNIELFHKSSLSLNESEIIFSIIYASFDKNVTAGNTVALMSNTAIWNTDKLIATTLNVEQIGVIELGKAYNGRFKWVDNTISFFLDNSEIFSYTLTLPDMIKNPTPYHMPGYYMQGDGKADFELVVDNIYTDINYNPLDTPTATTITDTDATLNCTVNPNGLSTSYYFEYGTTTGYGSVTSTADAGSDAADKIVTADLKELNANTTYHFRIVVTNSNGIAYGDDQTFQTTESEQPETITSHTVLTPSSGELTIPSGEYIEVFGSSGANTINVKSGGKAVCRNLIGSTVVNIEDDSSGFTVCRSGAMVSLENTTTGALVKIPATRTPQTIKFGDISCQLVIESGKVMFGTQIVDLTPAAITGGSAVEEKTITNTLGMTFNLVSAGTFTMGSPANEPGHNSRGDETQHQVTLTSSYYMQTTEVTQAQWEAVMGSNPSYFSSCGSDCPVEQVSWDDAQEFINKLNQKGEGVYMLPTEAQWEYAARAGSTTAFANGEITETGWGYDPNLDAMGWYGYNSSGTTHPVAIQKTPNAWGLYDMHGNVWEWCQDWYGSYSSDTVTDPEGPSTGSIRVFRGGSWRNDARLCRSPQVSSKSK